MWLNNFRTLLCTLASSSIAFLLFYLVFFCFWYLIYLPSCFESCISLIYCPISALLFRFMPFSLFYLILVLLSHFMSAPIFRSLIVLLLLFVLGLTSLYFLFSTFKIFKQALLIKFLNRYLIRLIEFFCLFLPFGLLLDKTNCK